MEIEHWLGTIKLNGLSFICLNVLRPIWGDSILFELNFQFFARRISPLQLAITAINRFRKKRENNSDDNKFGINLEHVIILNGFSLCVCLMCLNKNKRFGE